MANPTQNDIDVAVRAFVALASGLDSSLVIPGNDPHPSPSVPYASVLEITEIGNGIDSEIDTPGLTPETKILKNVGSRTILYSVNFYKAGAADFIKNLLSFPSTTPGQIFLAQNNLTWSKAGSVRRLDSEMGSKFEERRQVDIELKYQSRREVGINSIGSVDIELDLSAEIDYTELIEVTDA